MEQHPPCGQCGRPAIGSVNGVNLCVDCYSRFQAANTEQMRHSMAMMNYLTDQMDDITGLGGLYRSPRIQVPPPSPIVASRGPMTFHNINVQGSVVGAINTGQVQQIDVAIDHIKLGGNAALAETLKQFTEAVLADTKINAEGKKDILEQLSFLTTQTTTAKEQRKPGMIRSVMEGIAKATSISTSLVTLWEKLHPLLSAVL